MYKYKSKDGNDFFIPGVGHSVNGIIESQQKLEAPSLELVSEPTKEAPVSPVVPPVATAPPVPTPAASTNNEEQK